MPRIVEYDAKDTKLTPLGEGETAWTGAGRRIGPAYNEAATLIREANKSVVEGGQDIAAAAGVNVRGGEAMAKAMDEQARGAENVMREAGDIAKSGENVVKAAGENVAAGKAQGQAQMLQADQIEKLEKAFLSQYKDLFDIGEAGASSKGHGGGGGGFRTGRGGSSDPFGIMSNQFQNPYGAADEILNGATALTRKLQGNPGGKEINLSGGDTSANSRGLWSNDKRGGDKGLIGPGGDASVPGSGGQDFSGGAGVTNNNGQQTFWQPIGPNADSAKGWNTYGGPNQDDTAAGYQPSTGTPYAPEPGQSPSGIIANWGSQIGTAVGNFFSGGGGVPVTAENENAQAGDF